MRVIEAQSSREFQLNSSHSSPMTSVSRYSHWMNARVLTTLQVRGSMSVFNE